MKTFSAKFVLEVPRASLIPAPTIPEIAVVGRSNTGKSSLINMLVGQKGLARVSRRPGRTRSIIYFEIDKRFFLVDLPGYGFAAVSKQEQASWKNLVQAYLGRQGGLKGVLALFDIRRVPDESDFFLVEMFNYFHLNWQAVWTKADKIPTKQVKSFSMRLENSLISPRPGLITSSKSRLGREQLLDWIERQVGEE